MFKIRDTYFERLLRAFEEPDLSRHKETAAELRLHLRDDSAEEVRAQALRILGIALGHENGNIREWVC